MRDTRSKDDLFSGSEELHAIELAPISMRKFGLLEKAVPEYLEGTCWAMPVFFLTDNNKTVNTATCQVLGELPLASKRKAVKDITGDKSTLSLRFPDMEASAFKFRDTLTSDYISTEALDLIVLDENGAALDSEALKAAAIPPLSLRMFILPMKGGQKCKISVLVFPLSTQDMAENHPLHSDPAFPGSTIWTAEIPLGIETRMVSRAKCGLPILPVLRTLESLREEPFNCVPSSAELRFKMACLMNTKTVPVTSTGKALLDRYISIKEHGEAKLKRTSASWSWPEVLESSNKKGKTRLQHSNPFIV